MILHNTIKMIIIILTFSILISTSIKSEAKNIQQDVVSGYQAAITQNTFEAYAEFYLTHPNNVKIYDIADKVFATVKKENSLVLYVKYLETFKGSYNENAAIAEISKLISEKKITSENLLYATRFIDIYSQSKQSSNALTEIFNIISNENTIKDYSWFIDTYPQSKQSNSAVSGILNIVTSNNNIAGYVWFINKYSRTPQAKDALIRMHQAAYVIAKDINTIDSYNDFVIAYPYAKQVKQAENATYELEKAEYTGFFSDEEKEARRLLVQSKILEQSSEDLPREHRIGYMMVVNRMNDLLKREFNSTDAALRHLESNEFKSFVKTFKSSMRDLKRQVARIADNTEDLSSIMKNQSNMMNNHFENSAQDRQMSSELTKQHRFWERYVGKVGY